MHSFTTSSGRWLAALLLVAGLVQTADAQRTVTLRLNSATLPDTTSTTSLIEVRGALNNVAPATLPDGNVINWGPESTLEPTNVGGDYWEVSFQIADTDALAYKFFSEQADAAGGAEIGGWEDGGNHELAAGAGDTTLTLHFYEKGDDKAYDWRPFASKQDSVGVWFRVYMNTEAAFVGGVQYDRSATTAQQIGVRGDPIGGTGPLDWGGTLITLTREGSSDSKPGYDLFSGVAYYPASLAGTNQEYKFVMQSGGDVGWESSNNRSFKIPSGDSTLYWQYFSNSKPVTSQRVTSTIIAAVDLTPLEAIGIYDAGRGDTLQIRGGFNGWGCSNPTLCLLSDVPGEDVFEVALPLTQFPNTENAYKYYYRLQQRGIPCRLRETPGRRLGRADFDHRSRPEIQLPGNGAGTGSRRPVLQRYSPG